MANTPRQGRSQSPAQNDRGSRWGQYYDETTEAVARHPAQSVLIVFGVGFGLGLLLGHVLAEPPPEERSTVARLGRSVLDALAALPQSISQRVASLPESISQRLGR
jgi:hypothetical protein